MSNKGFPFGKIVAAIHKLHILQWAQSCLPAHPTQCLHKSPTSGKKSLKSADQKKTREVNFPKNYISSLAENIYIENMREKNCMKLNLISRVFFLRLDFLNFLAHYESGACITVTFTFSSLYFELLLPPVVSPKLAYQHQQVCCQFLQKNKFLKYLASIFRKCDISNGYVEVYRFDLFFF